MQVIVCVGTLRLRGEMLQVLRTVCHTHTRTYTHAHTYMGWGRETWPPRRDLEGSVPSKTETGKRVDQRHSVSLPGTRKHFELRHRQLRAPRSDQIRVFDICSQPTE